MNRIIFNLLLASASTSALFLMPRSASAALSAIEAAAACESVISQKPGLDGFQYNDTKAEPFHSGWLVTGKTTKGPDRRTFTCKIDDKGRVTTATMSSEPEGSAAKPAK